jgi:rhodanese-related sulfurtransferase
VSGSALGTFGQLAVFWPAKFPQAGCYRCAFPRAPPVAMQGGCSVDGVLGPVPICVGSLQALEALKVLASSPDMPFGEWMMSLELSDLTSPECLYSTKLARRTDCPTCGGDSKVIPKRTTHVSEVTFIPSDAFVVDVRDLGDSLWPRADARVPLDELMNRPVELAEEIHRLAGERDVICVCRIGVTSQTAARVLSKNMRGGDRRVGTLTGGIDAHYALD